MFFLFSSDIFITLRCAVDILVPYPAETSSPQDIRVNFQKQDARSVLWGPGVGEINYIAYSIFSRASDDRRPPSAPRRRFQFMRDCHAPQIPDGPEFDCYCVR